MILTSIYKRCNRFCGKSIICYPFIVQSNRFYGKDGYRDESMEVFGKHVNIALAFQYRRHNMINETGEIYIVIVSCFLNCRCQPKFQPQIGRVNFNFDFPNHISSATTYHISSATTYLISSATSYHISSATTPGKVVIWPQSS